MGDAGQEKDRLIVGSGPGCLHATALIHRDIDDQAPWWHFCQHGSGDEVWCPRTTDEDTADHGIRGTDRFGDVGQAAIQGAESAGSGLIEIAQAFEVDIQDGDARAHA